MFWKQERDDTCVESTHICCKDFLKNDDTIAKGFEIVTWYNLRPLNKPIDVSENEGKLFVSNSLWMFVLNMNCHWSLVSNAIQETKFLGCSDPRWKLEYLDSGQIWIKTGEEEEEELDESDKHI